METFLSALSRGYPGFVANIGLLALLAWVVTFFGKSLFANDARPTLNIALKLGVVFGLAAALLMNLPVEFQPGLIGDARGAPIIMAGVIGGPVSAVVTVLIVSASRASLGGVGAYAGIIAILCYGVGGVAWQWLCHKAKNDALDLLNLGCFAVVLTTLTAPLVLFFPVQMQYQVLVTLWPQVGIANLLGVLMLSTLVRQERKRQEVFAELVKAKRKADQAARAKAKFLAAMSHEIRTPLNGVLGILQLVLRQPLSDSTRNDLSVAHESGFFLLGLINQILDFAKIDAGKTDINSTDFRLDVLLDGIKSMFSHQVAEKNLTFDIKLAPKTLLNCRGDAEHIRQILFNLIGNAIKFTPDGSIELRVSSRDVSEGTLLLFELEDTGPGIPESDQDLIFEEFGQSDHVESAGGTGLGLSISRTLARQLGGDILVESAPGQGATFVLSVPVSSANSTFDDTLDDQDEGKTLSAFNVLVVEDNLINQMVAKKLLEQQGHFVSLAANGKEAVGLLKRHPDAFDVVLMDIQMPVMDGIEATERIRQDPQLPVDLPIIALTANAFSEQRVQYLDAGMNDVVTKPLQLSQINRAFENLKISERSVRKAD